MEANFSYKCGFIGGMVCSILPNIAFADILKTCILAIVGTVVSYLVSLLLRKVFKKEGR